VPAVLVTHDQREALAVGDRIGVMRAGRLVQIDRPEVVFHRPANRFVGAFLGEASFLPVAVADDGTPATDLGPVDQAGAGIDSGAEGILAMVRPDDLTFRPDERGDAEILSAGYQGVGWLYTVGLPSGHVLAVQEDHLATFAVGTRGTVTMTPGHRQVLVPDA
jgi:iron(III) transport system ATP-binding protein